jgi:NDP-sugar pyrophosphorylase family protein
VDAIILAGGPGTRLDPYTRDTPKPLLPLDGMPVLEIILRQLAATGFDHVTLALSYRADQIRSYVGDGAWLGLDVEYSVSDRLLGTAGPLGLIPPTPDGCLVCNGDVLTTLDFGAVMRHHRSRSALATVVLSRLGVDIPFGVAEVDGGLVSRYREKPTHEALVGTGIYVLGPEAWAELRSGEAIDMPVVIQRALARNAPISAYVHDGLWMDIGTSIQRYHEAGEVVRANRDRYIPTRAREAVA